MKMITLVAMGWMTMAGCADVASDPEDRATAEEAVTGGAETSVINGTWHVELVRESCFDVFERPCINFPPPKCPPSVGPGVGCHVNSSRCYQTFGTTSFSSFLCF